MVEGISRVRDVIAVSRLIPHGASLVPSDDSSQVPPPFLFFYFLFLVLWNQTRATGSHINQSVLSLLLTGSMGRN